VGNILKVGEVLARCDSFVCEGERVREMVLWFSGFGLKAWVSV